MSGRIFIIFTFVLTFTISIYATPQHRSNESGNVTTKPGNESEPMMFFSRNAFIPLSLHNQSNVELPEHYNWQLRKNIKENSRNKRQAFGSIDPMLKPFQDRAIAKGYETYPHGSKTLEIKAPRPLIQDPETGSIQTPLKDFTEWGHEAMNNGMNVGISSSRLKISMTTVGNDF